MPVKNRCADSVRSRWQRMNTPSSLIILLGEVVAQINGVVSVSRSELKVRVIQPQDMDQRHVSSCPKV